MPEKYISNNNVMGSTGKPKIAFFGRDKITSPEEQIKEQSPVTETSLINEKSLVKSDSQGLSEQRLSPETSLTIETRQQSRDLGAYAATLSYGKGHSRLIHDFTDKIFPLLTSAEQLLYIHLDRFRENGGSITIPVSWPTLEKRSGLSQSSLIRAAATLEGKGLIRKIGLVLGKNKSQGNRFWVFSPTSLSVQQSLVKEPSLSSETNIKEKELKENYKKGSSPAAKETKAKPDCPKCFGSGMEIVEGKGARRCECRLK